MWVNFYWVCFMLRVISFLVWVVLLLLNCLLKLVVRYIDQLWLILFQISVLNWWHLVTQVLLILVIRKLILITWFLFDIILINLFVLSYVLCLIIYIFFMLFLPTFILNLPTPLILLVSQLLHKLVVFEYLSKILCIATSFCISAFIRCTCKGWYTFTQIWLTTKWKHIFLVRLWQFLKFAIKIIGLFGAWNKLKVPLGVWTTRCLVLCSLLKLP